MNGDLRELLLEEYKKVLIKEDAIASIDSFYDDIFSFIDERALKATKTLLDNKIISKKSAIEQEATVKENIAQLKEICLESSKSSFLVWWSFDQMKKAEQDNQELSRKVKVAEDTIRRLEEDLVKESTNTVKDIEKSLENTRNDLITIGKTAEKIKEITSDVVKGDDLCSIQDNIIGSIDNIIDSYKKINLWPDHEEIPLFKKNEKVKPSSLKASLSKSKKKNNKSEENSKTEKDKKKESTEQIDLIQKNTVDSVNDISKVDLEEN